MRGLQINFRRRSWLLPVCVTMLAWLTASPVHAQEHANVPTYHLAYEYAQQLGVRHPELGFSLVHLPVTWQDIASLSDSANALAFTSAEQFWVERLRDYSETPYTHRTWLQAGARLSEKAGSFDGDFLSRASLRSHVGFFPDEHLAFVNAIRIDEELDDDPRYIGKRWRGFTGYTEQAYALLHFDKYVAKFGRDFIWWGRGHDASLLLSDYAQPLDQFYGSIKLSRLQAHYLAAKLDSHFLAAPDTLAAIYGSAQIQRFLSAFRVEWEVKPRWLTLAVSQMVLYGGPGRSFEWAYLNPFIFFHGEQLNGPYGGNTFGALDFVLRPKDRMEFYGQLLVDDVQIERTGKGDLEPNEIGILVGGQMADPLGMSGLTLGLEYTRVANRTYNTLTSWEKFLHRNRPLAHFLGNDFDRALAHGSMYLTRSVQLAGAVEIRRRGEGRIEGTFGTPWENVDLDDGYREKFPSGVVERSTILRLEGRWHPFAGFYVSLAADYTHYRNFGNVKAQSNNESNFMLKFWWENFWWMGLD